MLHMIIRATVGAALFATALAAPAAAESTLEKIRRTKAITLANTGSYPPMGFMQDGVLAGFDLDFGNELAKRLDAKPTWVVVEFKGMLASVKSGRADLLVSAVTITAERAEQIAFSDGYIDFGLGAAYRSVKPVKRPADAAGMVLGVQTGSPGASWARDNLVGFKEVKTYDTLLFAIKDLAAGRVDFVVNNLPGLRYNLRDTTGLEVSDVWDSRVAGIGARKEDADLVAAVNPIIKQLDQEGFLLALRKKWFGS
jgi:ABC-type amino acid transport substrate-binding protein